MRKLLIPLILLVSLVLGGCDLLQGTQTAPSDSDMETQVAMILTAQPTATSQAPAVSPTVVLVTPQATKVEPAKATPTTAPAVTQPPAPTATALPQPTATATTPPQPTPTFPSGDPRSSLGTPTFTDKLDNDDYWPTGEDVYTSVTFRDGKMLLAALTDTDGWRLMAYPRTTNYYLEITGRFEACAGTDHFGLFVRVPETNPANRGYLMGINCAGQFRVAEWDGAAKPNGKWETHIRWTTNDVIQKGANATNRIGVMASGSTLALYVNGVKMGEITDTTFADGFFGIFVGADETQNLTVQIDELNYWAR